MPILNVAAAFTAATCAGTHLLVQPAPGGAACSLVLAAASLADGRVDEAVLCAERGGPHGAPLSVVDSCHPQMRPSKVSVESRANVIQAYADMLAPHYPGTRWSGRVEPRCAY